MQKFVLVYSIVFFNLVALTNFAQLIGNTNNAPVMAIINDKSFTCQPTSKSINFLSKGIKGFIEKPFFQFNFISTTDERNLLIQVINVVEGTGIYASKQIEANYSILLNAKEEDFYGHDTKTFSKTEFNLEITKWEKVNATQAKISGTFSGKLNSASNSSLMPIKIDNGEFTNVIIDILLTQGDIKEMSK